MNLTRDEVLAHLADDMHTLFEIPRESVVPQARLYEDLDLDSIDAVDMIIKLQEMTGRKVSPEDFKSVRTVADVQHVVERLLAEAPAQPGP